MIWKIFSYIKLSKLIQVWERCYAYSTRYSTKTATGRKMVNVLSDSNLGIDQSPSGYLPFDSWVTIDLSATTAEVMVECLTPIGDTFDGDTTNGDALGSFTVSFRNDAVLYLHQ